MNGLLFTNVLMYVSRAELVHLSGEGRWDKQEGTEGSYKVLVPTKMMVMMRRRRRRTRKRKRKRRRRRGNV